jgi:hypothetical protein
MKPENKLLTWAIIGKDSPAGRVRCA